MLKGRDFIFEIPSFFVTFLTGLVFDGSLGGGYAGDGNAEG